VSTAQKTLAVIGVLVMGAAVVGSNAFVASEKRKIAPTVYSDNGLGLSVFHEWLTTAYKGQSKRVEAALFDEGPLQGQRGYVLFAPGEPVGELKEKLLEKFVKDGGTLYLSAHDERTLRILEPLLRKFQLNPDIEADPDFKNNEPVFTVPSTPMGDLKAGETYAFYSLFRFRGCRPLNIECYALQVNHFKGQVYVFLGLPPIANGLLLRADNHRLAERLAAESLPLAIDEYDHFYSNRELDDLLQTPAFFLPAAGMLLALILFLVFGDHPVTPLPSRRSRLQSFHSTGLGVVAQALAGERGRTPSLQYLAEAFARRAKAAKPGAVSAQSRGAFLVAASHLIQQHRKWLESKRKAST
jgi:hypothetical protein